MILTHRISEIVLTALRWTFAGLAAVFAAVVLWILLLSAIAGPPPAPQCRAIHDGEVLVSSTLHTDGRLQCTYTEATAIYGRATTKRAGK